MATKSEVARLRRLADHLRKTVPADGPVRFRFGRMGSREGNLGTCEESRDGYLLRVDTTVEFPYAKATLIHEMAHAMAWGMDGSPTEHGQFFWEAHSYVFQRYADWLWREKNPREK